MTAKLTAKQQRFADEYLIDLNATQAAIRAGYSENSAKQEGSRLLTNDDIMHYIKERTRAISEKSMVDAVWLLDHLGAIATADIADIIDDTGAFKPVSEWPLIWRQMVNGLDIKQAINRDGELVCEAVMSELRKIKIMDRNAVLEKIGKHVNVGAFVDKHELGFSNEIMARFFDLPDTTGLPEKPDKQAESHG